MFDPQVDGDPALEWDIVGCCMAAPQILPRVLSRASPGDFWDADAARVMGVLHRMHQDRELITAYTVDAALRRSGADRRLLLKAFDFDTHRTLVENAPHHAEIIRMYSLGRRLRSLGSRWADRGTYLGDPAHWIGEAEAQLRAMGEELPGSSETAAETWDTFMADVEAGEDLLTPRPTGFPLLDVLLGGGLRPGHLIILGARTSVGKTTFACNIALTFLRRGGTVLFASLEMSRREVLVKLLAAERDMAPALVEKPKQWAELAEIAHAWPLHTLKAPITVDSVRNHARNIHPQLVVVDYLQLLRADRRQENRQLEVAAMTRALKNLATEEQVPVLAVAQLNRAPEARADHRPRMSDLRESGAQEQDADVGILLHREKGEVESFDTEVMVAKNRFGAERMLKYIYKAEWCQFQEIGA